MRYGCRRHGVPSARVEERWAEAAATKADVAVCSCCLGPASAVVIGDYRADEKAAPGARVVADPVCNLCKIEEVAEPEPAAEPEAEPEAEPATGQATMGLDA